MTLALSEYESKQLLAEAGVPVPDEKLSSSPEEACVAAESIGYPVALKLCGRGIAHKTERGLVRLGLAQRDEVLRSAEQLLARRGPTESHAQLLIAPMIRGRREVIAGLVRDAVFGPCVMLGLGGIFAEALGDVAFAVAPLGPFDAADLIDSLRQRQVLGRFRGDPEVDRERLQQLLDALGRIGATRSDVVSIDINPLIIDGSEPIVADALVELEGSTA